MWSIKVFIIVIVIVIVILMYEMGIRFRGTLHGHVAAVYMVAWSSDSRLLASSSKDSTIKVWSVDSFARPKETLSGHLDEVFFF